MSSDALRALMDAMPFAAALGVELVEAAPERVVARLQWRQDLCTVGGILHGGALMALADTTGAACAFLNLPAGASTATLSSSTNLVRAARQGSVTATAAPVHVGRSTIVVRTDLTGDDGRLVASTTQTQAVLLP